MSAAYLDPRVTLDAATREVRAEFSIRNESAGTWRPAEGFRLGYQLFDGDTGTLIVDGARVAPESDVKPGDEARLMLDFEVPGEDGRYQVLISPMREGVCWYYEQGWPFLLVEAETRGGQVALRQRAATTAADLRRRRELRAVGRAVVYPFRTIWRNRSLIRVMVRRDILGRYRGSFGGSFWTVINPLLLMLTYFFVFGMVLGQEVPGDPSRFGFALYLLAGMLPWLAFSEGAARAPTVMLEHRNFVKKLVFAVETLPFNLVVSGLVSELFAVILFCCFLLLSRHGVPLDAAVAAGAAGAANPVHRRGELVSGRARRIRPRPRADHRFPADHLVLPHADLLPRRENARHGGVPYQEPDICSGARLPLDSPGTPRAGLRASMEAVAALRHRLHPRTRLVLQVAQVFRGHDLAPTVFAGGKGCSRQKHRGRGRTGSVIP